jgi:hypothetical protein
LHGSPVFSVSTNVLPQYVRISPLIKATTKFYTVSPRLDSILWIAAIWLGVDIPKFFLPLNVKDWTVLSIDAINTD